MQNFLKSLITPPVFPEDEDKTRSAFYGHRIALGFMFIILAYEIVGKIPSGKFSFNELDFILIGLFVILFVCQKLIDNGRVRRANTILTLLLWVGVNYIAFLGFGVRDSAFIANFIVILAAGLLRGLWTAVILNILTIFVGAGLVYAEINHLNPTAYYVVEASNVMTDMGFIFFLFAVFMALLISGFDNAVKNAKAGKKGLEIANRELQESQTHLEESRNELLIINQQLTQRTERINAIAQLSKTVNSIQNIRVLLSSVANIISQRFGYYHVGIYLPDEQKQSVILRASNSKGGLTKIREGYRIRIGEQTTIGFVARSRQPRTVPSTFTDVAFFNDPELPDTMSEITLPLVSNDEFIGVLDIQAPEENAFSEEDTSTLSILADQVAIAIQNALLFDRSQRALREAEIASRQGSSKSWKEYEEILQTKGYRYDGVKSDALQETTSDSSSDNLLHIPIQIRGLTIGNLKLKPIDTSRKWTEDELAIIEATSDRVALALEGSRLLDDAQKRAARESFLSEVAAKLGTSFQLDSILRDTVEELGQTLKGSTVSFQLVNPSSNISKPGNTKGDQDE